MMKRLSITEQVDSSWLKHISDAERKDVMASIAKNAIMGLALKLVPDVKNWPIVLNFSMEKKDNEEARTTQFHFEMAYSEKEELFREIAKASRDLRMRKAFRDYDRLEGYDKSPWSDSDPDYRLWKLLKAIESIFPDSRALMPMEFDFNP